MKKLFLSALAMAFGLSMATTAMAADSSDTSSKSGAAVAADTTAQMVTGSVKSMDKDNGTLTVTDPAGNDIELAAKQADLQSITDGDTVTAVYTKSGDVNIASSVKKIGAAPGGPMGAPGTREKGGSKY